MGWKVKDAGVDERCEVATRRRRARREQSRFQILGRADALNSCRARGPLGFATRGTRLRAGHTCRRARDMARKSAIPSSYIRPHDGAEGRTYNVRCYDPRTRTCVTLGTFPTKKEAEAAYRAGAARLRPTPDTPAPPRARPTARASPDESGASCGARRAARAERPAPSPLGGDEPLATRREKHHRNDQPPSSGRARKRPRSPDTLAPVQTKRPRGSRARPRPETTTRSAPMRALADAARAAARAAETPRRLGEHPPGSPRALTLPSPAPDGLWRRVKRTVLSAVGGGALGVGTQVGTQEASGGGTDDVVSPGAEAAAGLGKLRESVPGGDARVPGTRPRANRTGPGFRIGQSPEISIERAIEAIDAAPARNLVANLPVPVPVPVPVPGDGDGRVGDDASPGTRAKVAAFAARTARSWGLGTRARDGDDGGGEVRERRSVGFEALRDALARHGLRLTLEVGIERARG